MKTTTFVYNNTFRLKNKNKISAWTEEIAEDQAKTIGELCYTFCDDEYVLDINKKYLNHNTYTDIITFDYTCGSIISGDVFISTQRAEENAKHFQQSIENEILRLLAHAILHLCGHKDKTDKDKTKMRALENKYINLFHVKQIKTTVPRETNQNTNQHV